MVPINHNSLSNTVARFACDAAYAVAANALLFGASRYITRIPTVSINNALTSVGLSVLGSTAMHAGYKAWTDDNGDKSVVKAGLLAAAVLGAHALTQVPQLTSKVSFLKMSLKEAVIHGAVGGVAVGLINYVWNHKTPYTGKAEDIENLAQAAVAAKELAEEAAENAKNSKDKAVKDAAVAAKTAENKAVNAFYSVGQLHTLDKEQQEAFDAGKDQLNPKTTK